MCVLNDGVMQCNNNINVNNIDDIKFGENSQIVQFNSPKFSQISHSKTHDYYPPVQVTAVNLYKEFIFSYTRCINQYLPVL